MLQQGKIHSVSALVSVTDNLLQDAKFPVLPRWFTDPIHDHLWHRQKAVGLTEGSKMKYIASREISRAAPHAYSLLEELYHSVFDSRFINRTPSGMCSDITTTGVFIHANF